jgi:hypothetical protein
VGHVSENEEGRRMNEEMAQSFQAFLHPANALKDSAVPGKKETCLFLHASFFILPSHEHCACLPRPDCR